MLHGSKWEAFSISSNLPTYCPPAPETKPAPLHLLPSLLHTPSWIKTKDNPFTVCYLPISSPSFARSTRPLDSDQAIPRSVANRISWPETWICHPIHSHPFLNKAHPKPVTPVNSSTQRPEISAHVQRRLSLFRAAGLSASQRSYRGSYCVQ